MNPPIEKPKKTLEELMETSYKLTRQMLSDLKEAFSADLTIIQACLECGINTDTYYEWLKESDEFAAIMERAQNDLKVKAKKVIKKAIDNYSIEDSWKLLEKREKKRYSSRTELTGEGGKDLPTAQVVYIPSGDYAKAMENEANEKAGKEFPVDD